jgi:aminoglycoside 6'-N-acetyltransferase
MELLPILTTRLLLRRFTTDDLAAFQSYRSDPELARYQGWEPMPDEEAELFLSAQANRTLGVAGEWLQVAVTLRDTGRLIGDLGLCVIDEAGSSVELGFTMSRGAQGQGYATEAVRGVAERLLGMRLVQSLVATTDARNTASVALLRRVGFMHKRTTPTTFRGEPCMEDTFELTTTR